MAIKINFDTAHNPETPTIILAKRNGDKIGQLNAKSIEVSDSLNDASEITFNVYKYIDDKKCELWEQIVDFKLIYCVEWNMWFECTVELDEATETIKTVFCTQLGQAELSQIMLYNIEINTENDIIRDDYKEPTVLYNEPNTKASLLHRIMEKAPHYSVIHVDNTIANIQRTFTFDDTSIYDAFQDIAEEIHCLFVFNSNSDKQGKIQRTISVYDLETNCLDCGHRGEFIGKCPECSSTNIKEGYGDDTTIFITSDELAEDIQLSSDTESIKNCFKLEAGDDLMTATIRNCNPNGTDYLWYISDKTKADMSEELVNKINAYDELYKYYQKQYKADLNTLAIIRYNELISKYQSYNKDLMELPTFIIGYSTLMKAYYSTIDLTIYLEDGLMPSVEMSDTNAEIEVAKLTTKNLSPVSVSSIKNISSTTADNAVLSMAKVVIDSRYKVKISNSSFDKSNFIWTGNFVVTNYSDEEDTFTSELITVVINDNYQSFVKQKIDKALNKEKVEDLSIVGLFEKSLVDFKLELKKYSLNCLQTLHDCCQTCIDVLIEQGITDKESWDGQTPNLYEDLYTPYLNKLSAIESETMLRENEVDSIIGTYDENGDLITYGLQNYIEDIINNIQNQLDFQKYLGDDLWLEFCAYRREDKYSNDNYISDGLNNAELFDKAFEFIKVAQKEIYTSAELQHSISTNLKNLLTIKKFEPIVDNFQVGNWLRIEIDDEIYKFRLINYTIDYDDLNTISVEFADVVNIKSTIKSVQDVISQASTMATSYSSTKRQAKQGEKSNNTLNDWVKNGLDATNTKIVGNADNQNQTWDNHGMLFREYDAVSDSYSSTQLKIINSTIAITDDNWTTTKTAIGKFIYLDPTTKKYKEAYGVNGEVIVGKLLLGEELGIYNSAGSLTFDDKGFVVTNDINTITINPNDNSLFNIKKKNKNTCDFSNVFSFDDDGNLVIVGNITANSLTLLNNATISGDNISGLSNVALSGEYKDLINKPTIPSAITDLVGSDNILYTDDVKITNIQTTDGTTRKTIEVGDITYDVIENGDFVLLGNGYGTDTQDGSSAYTYISKEGLLTAKNALIYGTIYATNGKFKGEIEATSLILGDDVSINYDKLNNVPDLSIYAKESELQNIKDAIPTELEDLTDKTILFSDNVIIENAIVDENGVVKQTIKVGDSSFDVIKNEDFILLGHEYGEGKFDDTKSYTYISTDGLLTAKNALVYGTIYATNGEFNGKITATEGEIGSWLIDETKLYTEYKGDIPSSGTFTDYESRFKSPTDNDSTILLVNRTQYEKSAAVKIDEETISINADGEIKCLSLIVNGVDIVKKLNELAGG
jgi:hypothetical protein